MQEHGSMASGLCCTDSSARLRAFVPCLPKYITDKAFKTHGHSFSKELHMTHCRSHETVNHCFNRVFSESLRHMRRLREATTGSGAQY